MAAAMSMGKFLVAVRGIETSARVELNLSQGREKSSADLKRCPFVYVRAEILSR